jgi:hypothetical protein
MLTLTSIVLVLAAQGQDFSWSGAVASGKRLSIRNVIGDIRIEPATGGTAQVTALKRAGRDGDPADVEIRRVESAEGIEICVIYPGSSAPAGSCEGRGDRHDRHGNTRNDTRVDFTVRLPTGAHLDAGTVSGDVNGRGLRGEVSIRSVSGDVSLTDVTGKVVEATTVSGDVRLVDITADEVVAETVSGDVTFSGSVSAQGRYDLKTLSGDVDMQVPRDAGAEVTVATFSGDFSSSFSLGSTEKKSGHRQRVRGTIGGGGARIRLESFSGDVSLRT